ncbi:MAG TPA: sugar ABC transporter ATP-binding protein [Thermodesulfobacteriota bacterium]|nr:sugar ABC transporter ATP-binding protein [Thermodesulfobacteriota bacterium]
MLEVKNIVKSFVGVRALKGVSITFQNGEIHGVVGENGAGKSTLMKIISGVYPPDSGAILLDGQTTHFLTPIEAYNAGIRIVYQELSLIRSLTIAKNMFIHRFRGASAFKFVNEKSLNLEAETMLKDWEIHIPPDTLVSGLSMGERQLVEIARELSTGGKVIILDEPTSSLTFKEIEHLFQVVRLLRDRGYIVIFISHRLNEVSDLVDRITVLRDGEVMASAETRNLDAAQICRLIAGKDMSELFPKTQTTIGEVALEVNHLSGEGFRDISFLVHWGEILGVAGLVGAGRSELVRALYGLNAVLGGEVHLAGEKIKVTRPEQAIDKKMGLLTEDRAGEGTFPDLSVSKNLVVLKLKEVVRNFFLDRDKIDEKTSTIVKQLGIVTYNPQVQIVSELSGGNQQKTVLGRLIGAQPKVLLLDEPTRGVDVNSKTEIHRIMGKFVNGGGAIVMVSSELDELVGVCDRILVLHEGNFKGLFERQEFDKENILRCMMNVG